MEDPHYLIQHLVQRLTSTIKMYGGSDKLFFEDIVIQFFKKHPDMIYEQHPDWNNGNIIHGLVKYMIAPHQLWLPTLSNLQKREMVYVLFQLMTAFNIQEEYVEYWGITPLKLLMSLASFKDADKYCDQDECEMVRLVLTRSSDIKQRLMQRMQRYKVA